MSKLKVKYCQNAIIKVVLAFSHGLTLDIREYIIDLEVRFMNNSTG